MLQVVHIDSIILERVGENLVLIINEIHRRVINVSWAHLFLLWEEVVAMTKYEKISLIISIASLAIQLIDLLK